jgi:hypothetical protein
MERKPNLGKRLAVGATFITTTKRMDKRRHVNTRLNKDLSGPLITYEVLRPGDCRHFTKGNRRYYCQVVALVELRTGYYCAMLTTKSWKGTRWYQFSYLVKILEN